VWLPSPSYQTIALGVGRHKDSSALTVLAQGDIEGLQVKRKLVGDWISVKPIHGAFIINVGDIIQVCFLNKIQSSNLFFGGKEI
jgi:isopenicillin N synthase-like dioxygenase